MLESSSKKIQKKKKLDAIFAMEIIYVENVL